MELKVFSKLNNPMTSVPDHSLDEDSTTGCQFVFCPELDVTTPLPNPSPIFIENTGVTMYTQFRQHNLHIWFSVFCSSLSLL